MFQLQPDDLLSPQELEARRKGEVLVARIECLAQTDEGFQRWLQDGFDEVQAGQVVLFDIASRTWH